MVREKLLACAIARLIVDVRHVAVGAASPMPTIACALLEARGLFLRVSLLHQRRGPRSPRARASCSMSLARGRIDIFLLGGAQSDGSANINFVRAEGRRFPGPFGSAFIYFAVKKTFLFREEHSPRVLVTNVEFVSALRLEPPSVWRRSGPAALFTGKALFSRRNAKRRFRLESVHSGYDAAAVRVSPGIDYDVAPRVTPTPALSMEELTDAAAGIAARITADYPSMRVGSGAWATRINAPLVRRCDCAAEAVGDLVRPEHAIAV